MLVYVSFVTSEFSEQLNWERWSVFFLFGLGLLMVRLPPNPLGCFLGCLQTTQPIQQITTHFNQRLLGYYFIYSLFYFFFSFYIGAMHIALANRLQRV